MYDCLETSILLHLRHKVTHRDIGITNILHRSDNPIKFMSGNFWLFAKTSRHTNSLYNSPTCLLIDFDNAYWEGHRTGAVRTTSALFVARSISLRKLVREQAQIKPIPQLYGVAKTAYIHVHGQDTYDVRSALHDNAKILDDMQIPVDELLCDEEEFNLANDEESAVEERITDGNESGDEDLDLPPHLPRHDAESCYYVIVVFVLLALPANALNVDDTTAMTRWIDDFERHCVGVLRDARCNVFTMCDKAWREALHPGLHPLVPFLLRLSEVVQPEYGRSDTSLDPYHLHEAMKRILWQEIWRLHTSGKPIEINRMQQRLPQLKQDGRSTTAAIDHIARTAEANATRTGDESQTKSGKRSRTAADSPIDPSASTSAPADGKKKRKTWKDKPPEVPTRSSIRQRKLRGE
ncbi:hypothetical protein AURDEDRAFT_151185 [Auricularia subglabra TFB-10046 SS5]|nr:hypothetical protein AURDEDRAFT_151185 [Auricularia subglabra TFB-10046 SS5]